MTFKRHLTAGFALGIALAALTGTAFAAPPSAPPGQEKKADQAEPAPAATQAAPAADQGTATAPGQVKKADEPAPAVSAPGQEQKAAKATAKSSGISSTTAGVKPSSTTQKWTTTTAGAAPDVSKRYGNGTTAAQIATSHGAPASTEIRGPGNSQPHKVCKKVTRSGKEVWADVHSVKSWPTCVTTTSGPTVRPTVTPPSISMVTPAAAPGIAVAGVAGAEAAAPTGGVGAAQPEAGGVAGALDVLGETAGGALPFTGFPLWAVLLAGIAAILAGWTLRRQGWAF